jgi:hypothetical protein
MSTADDALKAGGPVEVLIESIYSSRQALLTRSFQSFWIHDEACKNNPSRPKVEWVSSLWETWRNNQSMWHFDCDPLNWPADHRILHICAACKDLTKCWTCDDKSAKWHAPWETFGIEIIEGPSNSWPFGMLKAQFKAQSNIIWIQESHHLRSFSPCHRLLLYVNGKSPVTTRVINGRIYFCWNLKY